MRIEYHIHASYEPKEVGFFSIESPANFVCEQEKMMGNCSAVITWGVMS
jgi:hypothetical protein